jgi:predicted naringenin-chalcone synthase
MEIYQLTQICTGKNLSFRSKCFEQFVDLIFESYYPENSLAPDEMIHVSCTGYVSPSGAQKIVSKRNWGSQTTVTHAYHMGCYGSLPAIRIGKGFISSGKKKIDIVHTEICSLHSNPSLHQTDQLVSQSLFADGFIKYTLSHIGLGLKVLASLEEIIPHSTDAMRWNVSDWGFQMTLAREIPVLISRALKSYLKNLSDLVAIPIEKILAKALFAIHPGGPKILMNIQDLLALSPEQMAYSFQILKSFGNMSSATLPHIWKAILEDDQIANGTLIVSLAFGPGLTISGSIMEKVCGS